MSSVNTNRRLGHLVIHGRKAKRPRSWLWLITPAVVLIVVASCILLASGWLTGRFMPRKVIIRGCSLTPAAEVLNALGYNAGESVLALWQCARSFKPETMRWLKQTSVAPRWGSIAVVSVTERHPLLHVTAGGADYWLCDDGQLLVQDAQTDLGGVFGNILRMPLVVLHSDPGPGTLSIAPEIMLTAACCQEAIPSTIKSIEVKPNGELVLRERAGLPIRLGQPVNIPEKIGALNTALKICEQDRANLKYLDASNPDVFYEKLSTPQ